AQAAGSAGTEQGVATPLCIPAEKMGREPGEVAIATRGVQQLSPAALLLDEHRQRQRADPRAASLPVRDVDDVDAARREPLRPLDDLLGLIAARRQQLDADDEPAGRNRAREA